MNPSLHRHLKAASVWSLTALISWSHKPPGKEEELLMVVLMTVVEVSKETAYQAYFKERFFFFSNFAQDFFLGGRGGEMKSFLEKLYIL